MRRTTAVVAMAITCAVGLTAFLVIRNRPSEPRRTPGPADHWLDRAVAELPAIRADPGPGPATKFQDAFTEEAAALMLKEARDTKAERDRLFELGKYNEGKPPGDRPFGAMRHTLTAAYLYVEAGVPDDARRLLPAVKAEAAKLPDGLESWNARFTLALVRALLDNLTDEEAAKLPEMMLGALVGELERRGMTARAKGYAALARRTDPTPTTEPSDVALREKTRVRSLARDRDLPAARRVAEAMANGDYHRAEAFGEVAKGHHAAGDAAGSLQAIRDGLRAAAGVESSYLRTVARASLLRVAEETQDHAALSDTADALSAGLPEEERYFEAEAARLWARAARAYAGAGRSDAYAKSIARAETLLPKLTPEDQAMGWLYVATAKARALDKPGATAAVARSKAAFPLDNFNWTLGYHVHDAYMDAEDFAAATDAIYSGLSEPDDRRWALQRMALLHLRARRFNDGQKVAAEIPDAFVRFRVRRQVVIERIKADRVAGLAGWIDAQPTPHERALLNLAAAQHLLGIDGKGLTELYKVD